MTTTKKTPKQMPKGGRKGGAVFPRIALSEALPYAKKLVSKTHTSPQPADVILSGVVGSKSGAGRIRMSALKQYGFLKGDTKIGFSAEELAKKITAAPEEELTSLYQDAILRPKIFKTLFDTYHGDAITKAKLKQRAADLEVHPDGTESCADIYISGMVTAGLVTIDGDRIVHKALSELGQTNAEVEGADPIEQEPSELILGEESMEDKSAHAAEAGSQNRDTFERANGTPLDDAIAPNQHGPRAVFNVNVTLDSSLDIEKLQKQLELLKRFGAI